ncbi:MAG: undecaprenyl diphosphate synthase [Cyclobacteriaceae bacterium]|jgi:undecaprenyl diphosphate synthase
MIPQELNSNIPKHIAVIMDGNGRWAKKQGAARIFGHQNAITAVRESTEFCAENGVGYLTLYAFSTENWARPKYEVDGLMTLLVKTIEKELPTLQKNNVKLLSIGDVSKLPSDAQKRLQFAKEDTANNDGLRLILALNYSGKWELTKAMQAIALKVSEKQLTPEEVTEEVIGSHLETKGIPDPELLIRTSGEMRISNFLLWQLAYAELYFTDVLWPDFRKGHMLEALLSFQKRERRFGKTSEQLTK